MSDPTPGDLFDRWLAHRAKDEAEGSTASTTPTPPAPPVSDTESVVPSTPQPFAGEVVIQDTKASRAAAKARLAKAQAEEAARAEAASSLLEAPAQPVRDRVGRPPVERRVPEPVTEPVPEPAFASLAEPITEPVTEPEPVTGPVATPLAKPVAEPVAKPVAEPVAKPVAEPVTERAVEPTIEVDPDNVVELLRRATPSWRATPVPSRPAPAAEVDVPEVPVQATPFADVEVAAEPEVVPEPELVEAEVPEVAAVAAAEAETEAEVEPVLPPAQPTVVEGRRKAPLEVRPDPVPTPTPAGERVAPLETAPAAVAAGHHVAAPTAEVVLTDRERLAQQLRRPTRVPSQRGSRPVPPRPRTAPDGPTAGPSSRVATPSATPAETVAPGPTSDEAAAPTEESAPEELFLYHERLRDDRPDDGRPRYVSPAERAAAAAAQHRPVPDDALPDVVELTAPRTPVSRLHHYGFLPAAVGAALFLVIGLTGLTWAIAVAAMLAALALVLLVSRAATSSVLRVVVKRGVLEVERRSGWLRFDLTQESTLVVLVGSPLDVGWKAEVEGPDGSRCVLDATVVDPEQFVRVLRHFRPDA